jgi:hypothetical protein
MRFATSLVAAALLFVVNTSVADVTQVQADVRYLASEELAGRMTGTDGERLAAEYISAQLKAIGAQPLPGRDSMLHPFEFTAGMDDGGSSVTLHRGDEALVFDSTDVQALSFSDNATVRGEIVFAGYGLYVPEEKGFGYDSYFGLDVKDKIVVVLRYVPADVDDETRSILARYSGLRYKALHARELGAKAIVLVSGPRSPNAGETIPMSFDSALGSSGIVATSISGVVAEQLFASLPEDGLEKAQQELDSGNPHIQGFALPGLELSLETKVIREKRIGHNVLAMLPPTVESDQWLVVGAHYDHLGSGDRGSSLAGKEDAGKIHFGADDNASGVAATLEVARRLKKVERPMAVAFGFWSGEELGLLGSTHFVKEEMTAFEPPLAYLNFDMVGRMRDEEVMIQSVGSSPVWRRLIEQTNVMAGLDLSLQDDPYLPTDSTTFYQAEVPALHLFTGSHEHYHKPTDTAETLNYEGIDAIAMFTTRLVGKLMRHDGAVEYATVERRHESGTDRDTVRAWTGTVPDYSQEVEGLLLSGVIGGGPADQAGLQKGDVIVRFGEREITNIYDYTFALDVARIDEELIVEYLRDGERKKTTLTPTQRK